MFMFVFMFMIVNSSIIRISAFVLALVVSVVIVLSCALLVWMVSSICVAYLFRCGGSDAKTVSAAVETVRVCMHALYVQRMYMCYSTGILSTLKLHDPTVRIDIKESPSGDLFNTSRQVAKRMIQHCAWTQIRIQPAFLPSRAFFLRNRRICFERVDRFARGLGFRVLSDLPRCCKLPLSSHASEGSLGKHGALPFHSLFLRCHAFKWPPWYYYYYYY